jgi:hypothetical protein
MGTGGLVTIIPNLSDLSGKQQIAGISQEWVDRLDRREAADYPKKEHWGSTDKKLVDYYKKNVPGFEHSFIVLTNPQLGTRGSRRVVGEYVLTEKDMNTNDPVDPYIAFLVFHNHRPQLQL